MTSAHFIPHTPDHPWFRWTLVACWIIALLAAGALWALGGWIPQHLVMIAWLSIATILTLLTRFLVRPRTVVTGFGILIAFAIVALLLLGPFEERGFAFGWVLAGVVMVATTSVSVRDLTRSGAA